MTEIGEGGIFKVRRDWSRLVDGIRKTEAVLTDLPPEKDWADLYPKGPTLAEARSTLNSNRESLLDQLRKKAESIETPELSSSGAATGHKQRTSALGTKLKSFISDTSCTPIENEQLWIAPFTIGSTSGSDPSGNSTSLVYTKEYPYSWNFVMTVEDNNDPFNYDVTDGWFQAWYRYELPARAFPARYDLSIHAGIDLNVTSRSNHIYGTRWWQGWVNGGLGLEGESYDMPNSSLPIYDTKAWNLNDWDTRTNVLLERSVVLPANQSILAEVGFMFFITIDRGLAVANGWYFASNGMTYPHPPELRCIITPE